MTHDKRTGHKIMYLAVNKTLGKPDGDDDENYVGTIDELTLQDILENPRPWKGDIEIVTGQIEQLRKERDEWKELRSESVQCAVNERNKYKALVKEVDGFLNNDQLLSFLSNVEFIVFLSKEPDNLIGMYADQYPYIKADVLRTAKRMRNKLANKVNEQNEV